MRTAYKNWWAYFKIGLEPGPVKIQDLAERAYLAGWIAAKREDVRCFKNG